MEDCEYDDVGIGDDEKVDDGRVIELFAETEVVKSYDVRLLADTGLADLSLLESSVAVDLGPSVAVGPESSVAVEPESYVAVEPESYVAVELGPSVAVELGSSAAVELESSVAVELRSTALVVAY